MGGVLVKTCIIALRRPTFLKRTTNPQRYQIVLRRPTFLKEKQIHNVIKFSFLFRLTDL